MIQLPVQQTCPVFLKTIETYPGKNQFINADSIVRVSEIPNNRCRVEYKDSSNQLCIATVPNAEMEKVGLDFLA